MHVPLKSDSKTLSVSRALKERPSLATSHEAKLCVTETSGR